MAGESGKGRRDTRSHEPEPRSSEDWTRFLAFIGLKFCRQPGNILLVAICY
jgi:hypothetical protein